jgi:hypothetical protein
MTDYDDYGNDLDEDFCEECGCSQCVCDLDYCVYCGEDFEDCTCDEDEE